MVTFLFLCSSVGLFYARTILHPIPAPPPRYTCGTPSPPEPYPTSAADFSLPTKHPIFIQAPLPLSNTVITSPAHSALSVTRLKTAFVILAHPSSIYARNNVILAEDEMDAQAAPSCGGKAQACFVRSFVRSSADRRGGCRAWHGAC